MQRQLDEKVKIIEKLNSLLEESQKCEIYLRSELSETATELEISRKENVKWRGLVRELERDMAKIKADFRIERAKLLGIVRLSAD